MELNKKNYKNVIFRFALFVIGFFLFIFFITSITIGREVQKACNNANKKYTGDCVVVLSQVVDDVSNNLDDRKRAVWALGQLGDGRALVVLTQHLEQVSEECSDKESICRYELEKAMHLGGGGINVTAPIWRNKLFGF